MEKWLGEPSRQRWRRDSSSLILQRELQKARVELSGCVRLGSASQSLLEHSSRLLKTRWSRGLSFRAWVKRTTALW